MAVKGVKFTGPTDERLPRGMRARWRPERIQDYIDQHNQEYEIVGECKLCPKLADGGTRKLIAREVIPHMMTHIKSTRARQIIGMIMHDKTKEDALKEIKDFLAHYPSK